MARIHKVEAKALSLEARAKALNPQGQDQGHKFVSSRILEDYLTACGAHWRHYAAEAYYGTPDSGQYYHSLADFGLILVRCRMLSGEDWINMCIYPLVYHIPENFHFKNEKVDYELCNLVL